MALSVDASNACIPPSHPLITSVPPLPSTTRGEPCVLDGRAGRLNASSPILLYASGKLVVVRTLGGEQHSFCYRGHTAPVTAAAFSTSGAYVASADARGKLRVWSYDNEEHLVKLELQAMSGPIRGIAWDVDSMRIAIVGERGSDASSDCCRIIQWDTGVTCGELGQHARGRASSVAFKLDRPLRIVTGGTDDSKLLMNAGPPFKRLASSDAHVKGAVHAVAYGGTVVASVGTDKSVCIHDGKTLELIVRKEHVHEASIYACAWSSNDKYLLTCSADGTVKLLEVGDTSLDVVHTWNVLSRLGSSDKVPIGGMQLGCAFVKDDVPVTVGMNGEIVILPRPPVLGGTVAENEQVLTGHHAPISCLAVCDGFFYTADTDGVIVQWNSETGKAIKRLRPSDDEDGMYKIHGDAAISCITVTSDGTLLSAGWDDTIRISRNAVVTPNHIAMDAQPNAIACGTNLVVVMTVGGLVFVKDDTAVSHLIPLDYTALSICISKDDSTVYVGGEDCKIHIYAVTSSFELNESNVIENGHLKPIHALALSHDQTKLASADVRDVCVWNLADGHNAPIVTKGRWCFHTQRITCLAWSYDDSIVASGGADDSIYLWSLLKKTKRVQYSFCHRGGVTGLQFLGEWRLLSVGVDACVNQWDVADDVAKKFG